MNIPHSLFHIHVCMIIMISTVYAYHMVLCKKIYWIMWHNVWVMLRFNTRYIITLKYWY